MPTVDSNRDTWNSYDWRGDGGEEWSSAWGGSRMLWRVTLFPRLGAFLPAKSVLEIAPGGGRVTAFLVDQCERLDLVDISQTALDTCRARFREHKHLRYHLGDGASLAFLPDASVDLVVSWDSLVHAEAAVVRGYVHALATKLRPGGMAVIHHSNLGACRRADGGYEDDMDRPENGWRAPSVSAEAVRQWCDEAGLACAAQEIFAWSRAAKSDCLTVFGRPAQRGGGLRRLLGLGGAAQPAPRGETVVLETDMPGEMARARHLAKAYATLERERRG